MPRFGGERAREEQQVLIDGAELARRFDKSARIFGDAQDDGSARRLLPLKTYVDTASARARLIAGRVERPFRNAPSRKTVDRHLQNDR
jgi:hypothetical protein